MCNGRALEVCHYMTRQGGMQLEDLELANKVWQVRSILQAQRKWEGANEYVGSCLRLFRTSACVTSNCLTEELEDNRAALITCAIQSSYPSRNCMLPMGNCWLTACE